MATIDGSRLQELRDLMDRLAPDGEPEAFYVTGSPPDARPDRCLVLDAAFNPPTRAHLALAHHGAEASNADRVLLQVSATNVDKGISGADLGQRLYMVSRLAGRLASIDVSACSHARFVDKASALQKLSPNTCKASWDNSFQAFPDHGSMQCCVSGVDGCGEAVDC